MLQINSATLTALATSLQAAFSKGLASGETFYQKFCSVIPSNGRSNTYPNLSDWPEFREWVGARVFKNISGTSYTIENKTYEASIDVKREDVEDDNLGVVAHFSEASGMAANMLPDQLVAQLMAQGTTVAGFDGVPFFSANHLGKVTGVDGSGDPVFATQSNVVGNTADGLSAILICTKRPFKPFFVQPRRPFKMTAKFDPQSEAVFNQNKFDFGSDGRIGVGFGPWMMAVGIFGEVTAAKYQEARQKMAGFTSDTGRLLGLVGDTLMFNPASEIAALEILTADKLTGGKTNVLRGTATPMLNPYLGT